jgi:hypothetical protein
MGVVVVVVILEMSLLLLLLLLLAGATKSCWPGPACAPAYLGPLVWSGFFSSFLWHLRLGLQ